VITERLLVISGEDSILIDRKNLPAVTLKLPTRIMLVSNELPRLTDASGALASRFIILTLTRSFIDHEDTGLTAKLLTELPGILLWALEGWKRLQARGKLVTPGSSLDAVEELGDLASPISAFVKECCEVAPGKSATPDRLFISWKAWCQRQGRDHPGTLQSFCRDLRAAVPGLAMSKPRKAGGGGRERVYEGIEVVK